MKHLAMSQTFDRSDVASTDLDSEKHAAVDGRSLKQDRTGAACAAIAGHLGPGHA
jgi:hypothetical protein